jgi:type I restriction enzyme S subunit
MSWHKLQLGDVIRLKRGHDLPSSARIPGEVPIVSSSGVTGFHNVAKVTGPGVVTGRYGTLGEVHYIEGDYWPLNTALYVEDFKGNHPRYVAYLLMTLELGTQNAAGAVPGINRNALHQMMVQVPDVAEQIRIASVLSTYDDLIETNRRRIALLEESARLLYREWFVQLRFPGHEQAQIVNGLPAGWSLQPLSALIEINPRTPFEKGKSYPFVPMQALSETSMLIGEREERVISGGAKFRNLDTLLARITPCLENGKTGFVQFLTDDAPVASGSTEFIVMRSRTVSPYWVYCLARSEAFREHAIGSMAGSDGRQRVNPKCFDTFQALQAPTSVLDNFDQTMQPVFAQIEVLAQTNQRLQSARDALLPQLMSGQLDVSRLPLPEAVAL